MGYTTYTTITAQYSSVNPNTDTIIEEIKKAVPNTITVIDADKDHFTLQWEGRNDIITNVSHILRPIANKYNITIFIQHEDGQGWGESTSEYVGKDDELKQTLDDLETIKGLLHQIIARDPKQLQEALDENMAWFTLNHREVHINLNGHTTPSSSVLPNEY